MKALFISNNHDLFNSLRRALRYLASIELCLFSGRFTEGNTVIYVVENDEFNSWLWGQFRKKSRSPLLVFGFEKKDTFISRNPVFVAYSDEHAYFKIPFELPLIVDRLSRVKPLRDHDTRKRMVADYSQGYEFKLITHDLKIIQGNKDLTLDNFLQIRDFYLSQDNTNFVKIIDDKLVVIKESGEWESLALDLRNILIEKVERGK